MPNADNHPFVTFTIVVRHSPFLLIFLLLFTFFLSFFRFLVECCMRNEHIEFSFRYWFSFPSISVKVECIYVLRRMVRTQMQVQPSITQAYETKNQLNLLLIVYTNTLNSIAHTHTCIQAVFTTTTK